MTDSQVAKIAARGFRVLRADEFAFVIREWNGEGWHTIRRIGRSKHRKRNLRAEMTRMLRDPLTVRG